MITRVFKSGNSYAARIPKEFRPTEGEIRIEAEGDRWVLTPLKTAKWPPGFFDAIRIDDPAFERPGQGDHRSFE